jgi:hypothetical protein
MKRRRTALSLLAMFVLSSGCVGLPSINEISEPELTLVEVHIEDIKIGSMEFEIEIDIRNVNPATLYVDYLKVDFFIAGSMLGTADRDLDFIIGKFDTVDIELEYRIGMAEGTQTLIRLIQDKDFTYELKGLFYIKTAEGLQPLPFTREGRFGPSRKRKSAKKEEEAAAGGQE